ncbi:MAG: hypothetical protein FWF52_00375 [Candidatus Azobacteroides sp.]|nr:hypothetical protein [Candidatus Azobacteroides sp.]
MKNRLSLFFSLCIFAIASLVSCTKTDHAAEILSTAEQILEQSPDSALTLLDSIPNPYQLNDQEQNRYGLLQIQAKDKSYISIASDTVIFEIRDYYQQKNDAENTALSSFYCGRVLQEQGKNEAAMEEYLKADEQAEKTKNTNLKGLSQSLIGEIFLKELAPAEAVKHFKIAAQYFHEAKNVKNEIISYNHMGNAYLMNSLNDSAFYYYDKGLQLAKVHNDSSQIAAITQCIGVAYCETSKYKMAEKCFKNAAEYTTRSNDKMILYLNFSEAFYGMGMLDSAQVYINQSRSFLTDSSNIFVAADIYKMLSLIAEKQTDWKQSLGYYKVYADNLGKIMNENKGKELLELQKKYNYEHLQNEINQLKIRSLTIYVLFLIALLAIALLAVFFYKRSMDNKKLALERESQMIEAENKIYHLVELSNSYDEKEKSFRSLLLSHFDILKKTALLKQYLRKDDEQSHQLVKKFNEIVYGQEWLNWDMLYQDMNHIHNGLFSRLKSRYPILNEDEFRICCLTYADFSCPEIGIFMGLSPNTVQMKRSAIRKKLRIEPQGDIQIFLEAQLRS